VGGRGKGVILYLAAAAISGWVEQNLRGLRSQNLRGLRSQNLTGLRSLVQMMHVVDRRT
jgi:hypothetical protein